MHFIFIIITHTFMNTLADLKIFKMRSCHLRFSKNFRSCQIKFEELLSNGLKKSKNSYNFYHFYF